MQIVRAIKYPRGSRTAFILTMIDATSVLGAVEIGNHATESFLTLDSSRNN